MSFSMPPLGGGGVLAPGELRVQKREAPDREGRRGEARRDDDAKAKRDSPARNLKRRISGSGDDAAYRLRLYSRVEGREVLYSSLVALGSGALEPVSGFAEVDFRAVSVPVTDAKVGLSIAISLIRRERVVPERFFKSLLRIK